MAQACAAAPGGSLAAPCSASRFRRCREASNRTARDAESSHRLQVLDLVSQVLATGLKRPAALEVAGLSPGTWRHWRRWQQAKAPPLANRGRRPRCASRTERQAATRFLVEHGSHVPLHALREHLPTVARAELVDLRRRYRYICRWRLDRFRGRLIWKHVGAVWAIDFTEPKEYIGGTDRWILAIRDLASGYQLAWLSFTQATAEGVVEVLTALFLQHGAPLVLKSDNGCQFIAQITITLLVQWQVAPLFNPPRRPAYNGGLERTHPILKGYTAAAAQAQGRPAALLPEDLETGRLNANRFTRKLGPKGPTADEMWRHRPPITDKLRRAFQDTVQAERLRARTARGLEPHAGLTHYQQAAVDRQAIRDALLEQDLLEIKRKRRQPRARRQADEANVPCVACASADDAPLAETASSSAATVAVKPANEVARFELAPVAPPPRDPPRPQRELPESCASPAHDASTSCRITPASSASSCPKHGSTRAAPAHGVPGQPKTLRRLITPLINLIRRAKIR